MIGKTISHYQIVEKLGEGGMGVVYKARDTTLDRYVALKLLPPNKLASPERKQRFIQEAKAASALNHPHIVTIHEIAEEDGHDFIVMEYVAGKTLDALIPRNGMRLGEALKYAVQIADALAAAHAAGIIHRDIKPSNIMVGEDGRVRVLDFGLAKLAERTTHASPDAATVTAAQPSPVTGEGTVLGTPNYMSPEQAQGLPIDARSDIFSFGAVLYEMLTGRRAFQGDSAVTTMAAIVQKEPEPLAPETPDDLRKLVNRCLRKDLSRRLGEMRDVRITLEDLKDESDSGTLYQPAEPSAGKSAKRRFGWAAGLAAMAALLAVTLVWLAPWDGEPYPVDSPAAPVPLTASPGREVQPDFSPDGNKVVYSWDKESDGNSDIHIKQIGEAGTLQLTDNLAPDLSPKWSPDGRLIAFVRIVADRKELIVKPSIGGRELAVATLTSEGGPSTGSNEVTWCPDSKHLIAAVRDGRDAPSALYRISVDSGAKQRLTSPPPATLGDAAPAASPDGRYLAFARYPTWSVPSILLAELTDSLELAGEPRQLTKGVPASSPAWSPDGEEVIYRVGRERTQLWRISREGGEPELISYAFDGSAPALSAVGERMVYTQSVLDHDIWRANLPDGSGRELLIDSNYVDNLPQYSRDGQRIVFSSGRTGYREIWACDSDGGNPVPLTRLRSTTSSGPFWSPTRQAVAFHSEVGNQFDAFVVRADGGQPERLTDHPANDSETSWSRDGKWIYFSSDRDGTQMIWRAPAGGGEAAPVTEGTYAIESFDGNSLYVARPAEKAGASVWRIPVAGGEAVRVIDSVAASYNFGPTASGLVYKARDQDGSQWLWSYSSDSGQVERLFEVGKGALGLSVSPDGSKVLFTEISERSSDLMLVEGFR